MKKGLVCVVFICIVIGLFLFAIALRKPATDSTTGRMHKVFKGIKLYYHIYGKFPQGGNSNIIRCLQNPPKHENSLGPLLPELRKKKKYFTWGIHAAELDDSGRFLDSWGRPIVIEIDYEKRTVRMVSFGSNGKNDLGEKDDIVMIASFSSIGNGPTSEDSSDFGRPALVNPTGESFAH